MSNEIRDLTKMFGEATAKFNSASEKHAAELAEVKQTADDALHDIRKAIGNPIHGWLSKEDGFVSKDATELKAYFAKGSLPVETKDLSVTSDGQGVTVRSEWSNTIFKKIRESSPMRQVCGALSTTSNELEVLIDRGEPNAEWIAELTARAETDTSYLTRQKIVIHEHYAYPAITLQMLEDSQFNAEQWLQDKLITRFARQESNAFMVGDGVLKPRGILDHGIVAESAFTWVADPANYVIGAQYSGVDGGISSADPLFDLVDSLKSSYLPNASFLMTRAMRNILRKLKDSQGQYLLQPSLAAGVPDTLLGYPIGLAEDMPALAADVVGVLFGDFSQAYTIVDRIGVTVQRDAVTRPGWVKYFARRRIGGSLTNCESIKALVLGTAT